MKRWKLAAASLGVIVAFGVQSVWAAGFGIYEGSARGNALGTEVTADPATPSVVYNNPAAATELEGTQVEVGMTLIRPHVKVTTILAPGLEITSKAKSKWWTPPSAYVTHQINDQLWANVGVYSRYGLGIEYDDDWPGRYNVQEAVIRSIDINPSLSWKVTDELSLSAGFRAEWFQFKLYQAIPAPAPHGPSATTDSRLRIKGDDWGYGYNLSAFYKAHEKVNIGLAFES